ncbi:hypothetical protein [uncultured Amphritea sp.]|uniref:hypothetical protein n=1 Tax=uncultured Amphritea sp. TaxID=981605 RepID=UPI0025D7C9E0|nr:hypothetical protein [uncultured Amphritea sp.]
MKEHIRKIVLRLFPELRAAYHLPRVAVVVGVADTPDAGDICDPFRAHFTVDLQLLNEQLQIDESESRLNAVPMSVPAAGHEKGSWQYPEPGAWVEVCWLYGRPHMPMVRNVIPNRLTLPELEYGAAIWQHSNNSQQKVDSSGNWTRKTDGEIQDKSRKHIIDAIEQLQQLQRQLITVAEHSTEEVGGIKRIEALGAIKILSGGHLNISSLENLNITSAAAIQETAGKLKRSFAKELQHIEVENGGKVWLGNQSTNTVQILLDLIAIVESLAATCAAHTHPGAPVSGSAATFTTQSTDAGNLRTTLAPITE